jgi:spermidine/putrescine ABC transporter ATP-binding subunit
MQDRPAHSATNRSPVLEVRNLVKGFGNFVAVNNVSFNVNDGEFVFLIGPSGCGKTTTLRMIGGYVSPTSGDILVRGRRINDIPLENRNIGMVFQSYALFPHMTVRGNVEFGLRMRKVPPAERRERVDATLDLVEMRNLADRYPVQLSGGQRQRVAIARVLAFEPDILLLDEPLANLDKRLRDAMRVELKKLQEKVGITSIYVTHDQEEALSMADRIAIMEGGNLLQLGPPEEVYNHPRTTFVATFLGETSNFHGVVETIDSQFAHLRMDAGFRMSVACSDVMKTGEPMMVSIRPERVRVSTKKPSQTENVLEGTIDFVSYLGSEVAYMIRIRDTAVLLRASELIASGSSSYEQGQKVFASWDALQAVCLKR